MGNKNYTKLILFVLLIFGGCSFDGNEQIEFYQIYGKYYVNAQRSGSIILTDFGIKDKQNFEVLVERVQEVCANEQFILIKSEMNNSKYFIIDLGLNTLEPKMISEKSYNSRKPILNIKYHK